MDHSLSYLNINVGRLSIGNVGMPRLFSQKIIVVIEPGYIRLVRLERHRQGIRAYSRRVGILTGKPF
jgi:hypothetical protein